MVFRLHIVSYFYSLKFSNTHLEYLLIINVYNTFVNMSVRENIINNDINAKKKTIVNVSDKCESKIFLVKCSSP